MRTKIVLLLLLSLAVANSWASPLVTYSNLGPGGAIQCCIGLAEGVAQNNYVQGFQFQAGTSGSLASILLGYGTGPGTGSATFSLYSDSGNAPGSLLESMTGSGMSIFGYVSTADLLVTSSLHPLLTAGAFYWLIPTVSDPSHDAQAWNWNSTGAVGLEYFSLGGVFQGIYPDSTIGAFEVDVNAVTPIPEPSSLLLISTGLLGAAGTLRR